MIHEVLTTTGKKKKIERKLTLRCLLCGESISCPESEDFWFWSKKGEVIDFRKAHLAHAPEKAVGFDIEIVEKE